MLNTFNFHCWQLHFENKKTTMFHLSQLQSSLLLLSTVFLYHIVMLIILLYYTAILKEIILFVNKGKLR